LPERVVLKMVSAEFLCVFQSLRNKTEIGDQSQEIGDLPEFAVGVDLFQVGLGAPIRVNVVSLLVIRAVPQSPSACATTRAVRLHCLIGGPVCYDL
jgi:hypothetical protein